MMIGSFFYKTKAKEALRGNWQTAMMVAFFSGILGTLLQVLQLVMLPGQETALLSPESYAAALLQVPRSNWMILLITSLAALILSPALGLGCNHYFVQLSRKNDLGFGGLFSRMSVWGKALWLYVRIFVQIFLWSLLLFVPGIIAAIRYSQAPYFLAEDPDITAKEAIERSKAAMDGRKMNYFMLALSFYGWMLVASLAQTYLCEVNYVVGTVLGLAFQVWIAAYQNGAFAEFFNVVSEKNGMRTAFDEMFGRFEEMGMDGDTLDEMKAHAEYEMEKQRQQRVDDGTAEGAAEADEQKWSLDGDEDKLD